MEKDCFVKPQLFNLYQIYKYLSHSDIFTVLASDMTKFDLIIWSKNLP